MQMDCGMVRAVVKHRECIVLPVLRGLLLHACNSLFKAIGQVLSLMLQPWKVFHHFLLLPRGSLLMLPLWWHPAAVCLLLLLQE